MSATTETEPGGEMVCIVEFSARPRNLDGSPILGERRTFRVGERVRYLSRYFKRTPEDNPTGYMAVFEPRDSTNELCFAATQDYFVTIDCWEGLQRHLMSRVAVVMVEQGPPDRPQTKPTLVPFDQPVAFGVLTYKKKKTRGT